MDEEAQQEIDRRFHELELTIFHLRHALFATVELVDELADLAQNKPGAETKRRFLFSKVTAMHGKVAKLNPLKAE